MTSLKEDRKFARSKREKRAVELLDRLGIGYARKNGGHHIVISHNGKLVNWWPQGPQGGRWSPVGLFEINLGTDSLMKYIGVKI